MAGGEVSNKKFIKNVIFVIVSNLLTLVVGIVSGFLVPKMLTVDGFGYYKTFSLYVIYVGVFHFGFIDGILLKFAGKKKEEIDLPHFRMLFRFLAIIETIISLIGIGFCFLIPDSNLRIIFIFIFINLLLLNLTTFCEYIVQITMEFKRLSIRSVIRACLQLSILIVLVSIHFSNDSYIDPYLYIALWSSINVFLMIWYFVSYRSFLFGQAEKMAWKTIFPYFKDGFPLMVCNLVVMLICAIDQIFVNILFDNETYAFYAFSYTMISVITTTMNAIATVLFPTLKTMNDDSVDKYPLFNSYILMLGGMSLASFQVFRFIIEHFLTKYNQSIEILMIVMPVVLITSSITVVKNSFYKRQDMVKQCFVESLIVLVLSVIADIIVYLIFKNTVSISIVSIAVCVIWYCISEIYFCKKYNLPWFKNFIYMIIALASYYSICFIPNMYISFGVYVVVIIAVTLAFYHEVVFGLFKRRRTKA